jgi:hypothetical protein
MRVESNSYDNYRNTINDYFKGNWNGSVLGYCCYNHI